MLFGLCFFVSVVGLISAGISPALTVEAREGRSKVAGIRGPNIFFPLFFLQNGKLHENNSYSDLCHLMSQDLATLWWTYKKQLKMATEIVDLPIKNGDFPLLCKRSPEGNLLFWFPSEWISPSGGSFFQSNDSVAVRATNGGSLHFVRWELDSMRWTHFTHF